MSGGASFFARHSLNNKQQIVIIYCKFTVEVFLNIVMQHSVPMELRFVSGGSVDSVTRVDKKVGSEASHFEDSSLSLLQSIQWLVLNI